MDCFINRANDPVCREEIRLAWGNHIPPTVYKIILALSVNRSILLGPSTPYFKGSSISDTGHGKTVREADQAVVKLFDLARHAQKEHSVVLYRRFAKMVGRDVLRRVEDMYHGKHRGFSARVQIPDDPLFSRMASSFLIPKRMRNGVMIRHKGAISTDLKKWAAMHMDVSAIAMMMIAEDLMIPWLLQVQYKDFPDSWKSWRRFELALDGAITHLADSVDRITEYVRMSTEKGRRGGLAPQPQSKKPGLLERAKGLFGLQDPSEMERIQTPFRDNLYPFDFSLRRPRFTPVYLFESTPGKQLGPKRNSQIAAVPFWMKIIMGITKDVKEYAFFDVGAILETPDLPDRELLISHQIVHYNGLKKFDGSQILDRKPQPDGTTQYLLRKRLDKIGGGGVGDWGQVKVIYIFIRLISMDALRKRRKEDETYMPTAHQHAAEGTHWVLGVFLTGKKGVGDPHENKTGLHPRYNRFYIVDPLAYRNRGQNEYEQYESPTDVEQHPDDYLYDRQKVLNTAAWLCIEAGLLTCENIICTSGYRPSMYLECDRSKSVTTTYAPWDISIIKENINQWQGLVDYMLPVTELGLKEKTMTVFTDRRTFLDISQENIPEHTAAEQKKIDKLLGDKSVKPQSVWSRLKSTFNYAAYTLVVESLSPYTTLLFETRDVDETFWRILSFIIVTMYAREKGVLENDYIYVPPGPTHKKVQMRAAPVIAEWMPMSKKFGKKAMGEFTEKRYPILDVDFFLSYLSLSYPLGESRKRSLETKLPLHVSKAEAKKLEDKAMTGNEYLWELLAYNSMPQVVTLLNASKPAEMNFYLSNNLTPFQWTLTLMQRALEAFKENTVKSSGGTKKM